MTVVLVFGVGCVAYAIGYFVGYIHGKNKSFR